MRIGVDLGGTKIEVIALDESGCETFRKRVPTPQGDYEATVSAIAALVKETHQRLNTTSRVGIGIPGAISSHNHKVKNANSTCLIGKPLKSDIEMAIGQEVRISNDANCFTVSEAVDGAAAGATVVFGVIIGTGTGGAIVINRQAIIGQNLIAGEWGHNPLPWPDEEELPGQPCYCGKYGCIETWLSGTGFERLFYLHTGTRLSSTEIVQLAETGDAVAAQHMARYEERLAKSLASVINVVDPDIIVLGGGMSNIDRLYTNVPKIWGDYVFSDRVTTELVPPKHGDSSGVRGAAWLW